MAPGIRDPPTHNRSGLPVIQFSQQKMVEVTPYQFQVWALRRPIRSYLLCFGGVFICHESDPATLLERSPWKGNVERERSSNYMARESSSHSQILANTAHPPPHVPMVPDMRIRQAVQSQVQVTTDSATFTQSKSSSGEPSLPQYRERQ